MGQRLRVAGAITLCLASLSCMDAGATDPRDNPAVRAIEARFDQLDEALAAIDAKLEAHHRDELDAEERLHDEDRLACALPSYPYREIGIKVCDEFVRQYSRCIVEKMPEAAREASMRALSTTVDAWMQAGETPGGPEALVIACKTAADAVHSICGW